MNASSIIGVGAYLPMLRLQRRAAAAALRWSGFTGGAAGHRSVAGWDEDAVSMAVEAARPALGAAGEPRSVVFASTSAPFIERTHACILIDALALPRTTRSQDVANSRRCAVSALADALAGGDDALIAAGERRSTAPGSTQQLLWGDGAAAVRVGAGPGGARLLGAASLSHDFMDVYASRDHPLPYATEERFVRDVAVGEILIPAIEAALRDAGVAAADIGAAVVHEPTPGCYRALAAKLGLTVANTLEQVTGAAGDLGAAHVLFGLAVALAAAEPGQRLLIVGFGGGCEALVLEAAGPTPGADTARRALTEGQVLGDYVRFLSLTGSLELDWGPRSEFELKTSASTFHRHGRDSVGFIGGRDAAGRVQFPKSAIPVSPGSDGEMIDERLAEVPARVVSFTSDRLSYTPAPPFNFGLAQFDNGARVLMEFCDAPAAGLAVGDALAMRFRIKSLDRRRGFRTYFWKAAPAERPTLEV